ncbi:MAG: helix-turn-helix domain-containing protein [Gemmatimonadota bacterium]
MAVVATFLQDHVKAARVAAALRDQFLTVSCDHWAHLRQTLGRHPVSVVILDPMLDRQTDELRSLRRTYTSIAIVAYVSMPPTTEFDLFDYGRLGLDAIIMADRGDTARLVRATVERAEARGMLDPIRRALGDLNPTVRDAILMAISRAQQRLSPESMARAMGITRAHLASELAAAAFPSPHEVIGWGRMIVASRMLEDKARSANSVAAALEFPSGSAFRNACQRYLGAPPAEIRERGGATYAISAFFAVARRPSPMPVAPIEAAYALT